MKDTYLTILNSYGDIVELDYQFNVPSIIGELKSIDKWIDGSNNKKGLTLTGSVDDLELTKRNDTNINDNLKKCPSLIKTANQLRKRCILMRIRQYRQAKLR